MATLKELSKRKDLFSGGHRACSGCGPAMAMRQVLLAAKDSVVVSCATGCVEVVSTIFPYTAWKVPFIHSAFENSAATISGVEAAYRSLTRQGKYDREVKFIGFGGDGGTYDIGFQSLSGAMERAHRILYICYDNQAYMNTGIQRSSATPQGAGTTTAPAGKVKPGKEQPRKDLTACMVAHGIPYVAQTVVGDWRDLTSKVQKALATDGPTFINILAPCRLGWGFGADMVLEIGRLTVDTCFWPLYEVEDGRWKLNYKPKEKKSLEDWLFLQTRFAHLKKDEFRHVVDELQDRVNKNWQELLKKCEAS